MIAASVFWLAVELAWPDGGRSGLPARFPWAVAAALALAALGWLLAGTVFRRLP